MKTSEAQKRLNSKRKDKSIEFYEEYKGDKQRHKFLCNKCGNVWTTIPNTLKRKDNIGCPICYKRKLNIKKTKKQFSKERGATKLFKNKTLLMNEVNEPLDKVRLLEATKISIKDKQNLIQKEKQNIYLLKEKHDNRLYELRNYDAAKICFGPLLALVLFPIWLFYQFYFFGKKRPYKKKVEEVSKELALSKSEYQSLYWNLQILRSELENLKSAIEYEKNLLRLKNRINFKIGGKTNLYYFRFGYMGHKYYKIGVTIRTVNERYKNFDGSDYKPIEKIFFDTNIREAKRIERLIKHVFKDKQANDKSILSVKGGYSEVFVSDVLNLDNYESKTGIEDMFDQ